MMTPFPKDIFMFIIGSNPKSEFQNPKQIQMIEFQND